MLSNVDRDIFMILFDDEVIGNGVSKIYFFKVSKICMHCESQYHYQIMNISNSVRIS